MNPSATGWIKKLIKALDAIDDFKANTLSGIYNDLRACGYIYGSNSYVLKKYIDLEDYSSEEICKINHVLCLYITHNENSAGEDFIQTCITFYTSINAYKSSFLAEFLGAKKDSALLEKIIHKRIQIDNNLIDKSFNYFITNALLFVDILAFQQYVKTGSISEQSIQQKEAAIETIVLNTLNSKVEKSKYDNTLIDLFEQSLRYQQLDKLNYNTAISFLETPLEKQYIIDLACMSSWSDQRIDRYEGYFLMQLGIDLNLPSKQVNAAIASIDAFYTAHKDDIVLLGSKNIVKAFYDNSSKMVGKLISRNSKRLIKELQQSKELMLLLSQSTQRDLTATEHKQVQEQLLDIFKTIPSLAIFILPGGALLLPLVIKYIPKLLPSGFDDNRIEED